MSYSEAEPILRNNFRTEWQQRLDIGTEEDSIPQLDRAAQVTIFRLRTGPCQLLSRLHRLKISHSDQCTCGKNPQTPSHILQSCPHLRHSETPDMAQSGGCPQEALGTSWDTVADCRLGLTHQTEDLAQPGAQKKKKKKSNKDAILVLVILLINYMRYIQCKEGLGVMCKDRGWRGGYEERLSWLFCCKVWITCSQRCHIRIDPSSSLCPPWCVHIKNGIEGKHGWLHSVLSTRRHFREVLRTAANFEAEANGRFI